jgi:ornithine cyclodeaminase/alanine dehydrogenase-like protein (mu-crystallin family)
MLAISAETGETLAFLDDKGLLTDIRTAIGGAIATRALARDDAEVVGIVGTGTQARFQVRAHATLCERPLRFRVWGRCLDRARVLAAELSCEGVAIEAIADLEELCRSSDAIVTTTPSTMPLVRSEWVGAGTHITAMGADAPGKQELDVALVARADRLVADLTRQSHEHGEFSHASRVGLLAADRCVELGLVLSGDAPGRTCASEITIADLTGLATQDIAITRTVLHELGLLGR